MQGPRLIWDVNPGRGNAATFEVLLCLFDVVVREYPEADALADSLIRRPLQCEAMVASLLDAAKVNRIRILVADDEAEHVYIEVSALRKVARREG